MQIDKHCLDLKTSEIVDEVIFVIITRNGLTHGSRVVSVTDARHSQCNGLVVRIHPEVGGPYLTRVLLEHECLEMGDNQKIVGANGPGAFEFLFDTEGSRSIPNFASIGLKVFDPTCSARLSKFLNRINGNSGVFYHIFFNDYFLK